MEDEISELKFYYGFGTLDEINNGNIERFNSFDDLDIQEQEGVFIPKFIGAYEKEIYKGISEKHLEKFIDIRNELNQGILEVYKGKRENISPDLICIAYDPNPCTEKAYLDLIKPLKGDISSRVKIISSLELPDFSEKELFKIEIFPHILNFLKNPLSPENPIVAVLERDIEVLKNLREDYGLTREEATGLTLLEYTLSNFKGSPKMERLSGIEKFILGMKDINKGKTNGN
jgi:hypothetical protein